MTEEERLRNSEAGQKLRAAIERWYQIGGRYDQIIEIADVIYATKAASQPTVGKKG